ncbi:MAG: bifunctional DNA-formamidopyrimidine glycosylase/DNA-(apurinic or apyrimidinic site) lyase [Alphaproteobacteria bacterium]|nr:bifunctional DNA-formamidopyrimidine glycosylase/DNA-(apurinic or apyrimidinic site) lyase [Alphaproteobacteria bacterium]
MPELPEVETVRTGLENAIKGATIKSVTLRRKDLRQPFPRGFTAALAGAKILDIRRRAKYLLFELDNTQVVIAHLGMSGRFSVLKKAPKAFETHDHVVWHLADGRVVIYNDARRFGVMTLTEKGDVNAHPLLAALGPEPLENAFSAAYLEQVLLSRKAPIKPTLMDQGLVVGVGNIYASEALFLAGIHPAKPARDAAGSAQKLIRCIQKVLNDAIASGGSSLRDFVQVSGDSGYFQHHFNVYDRTGEPCFSCKTPIQSCRQSGRSTFFCPKCQS